MISPHGTHDIPPRYWTSPTVLKISPHIYHDIPPRYWTPPRYSRYPPTVLMIPPTVLNTPHGTHDTPHGTEHPPRYWAPPTVLHTHYTGCCLQPSVEEFRKYHATKKFLKKQNRTTNKHWELVATLKILLTPWQLKTKMWTRKRTEKEKSFGSTHHTAKVCRQTSEKLSSAYFRNISRKTTNFTKFLTRTLLK